MAANSANAWPFLFNPTGSAVDESLFPLNSTAAVAAAAAAMFPWNYFMSADGPASGGDPLFSASAAVLSAAIAARIPPPLPPPPPPFGRFGSSLPVGFGWPPLPCSTPVSLATPGPQHHLGFGMFSTSAFDPISSSSSSSSRRFDVGGTAPCDGGNNGHVFSMSASDLLKSFQLKVQAKSAAALADGAADSSIVGVVSGSGLGASSSSSSGLAAADDCRMVSSSSAAVDSFSDLVDSRCSSACSVDSPTPVVVS